MQHQLLSIEPHKVAKLEGFRTRGVDEVPMAAVHDNNIALSIELRSPGLAWRSLESIARQPPRRGCCGVDLDQQFVRDGEQCVFAQAASSGC